MTISFKFMFEESQIIDISLPLNSSTIIYPNNPEIKVEKIKNPSGTSFVSKIEMGSHSGTHIDAPAHVIENGLSIDQIPLMTFLGSCRVLDLTACTEFIDKANLENKNIKPQERILFKTKNSKRGFNHFRNDFIYLSPDGAEYLANLPIKLVGIDYLSIKQKDSSNTAAHAAFLEKNIPILEGIDLSDVSEGIYTLIAMPLKFTGIDGSPARIILLKNRP